MGTTSDDQLTLNLPRDDGPLFRNLGHTDEQTLLDAIDQLDLPRASARSTKASSIRRTDGNVIYGVAFGGASPR